MHPILVLGAAGLGFYYLLRPYSYSSAPAKTAGTTIGAVPIGQCANYFSLRGYDRLVNRAYSEAPSRALVDQLDGAIHFMKGPAGCEEYARILDDAQTHVLRGLAANQRAAQRAFEMASVRRGHLRARQIAEEEARRRFELASVRRGHHFPTTRPPPTV